MPAWHLRPRTAPEIIDVSIQLLRAHARPLLLLSVVLMIPGAVLGLMNALVLGDLSALDGTGTLPTIQAGAALLLVPLLILGACWFVVAFGALIGATSAAYVDGVAPEPADALRRVRPRAGTLLGAGILTYLLVMVQFFALMLAFIAVGAVLGAVIALVTGAGRSAGAAGTTAAGIVGLVIGLGALAAMFGATAWLLARYVTLPAVAVNESLGVRATMRRARELSRGSIARVTALVLLVGVLFLVVSVGGLLTFAALLRNTVAASVLVSVVHVPLYALGASLVTVLYYDLRVRHEGLDIELLAQEIAAEPTMAGSPGR